ncbi:MAG TPA: acyltransferase family protein, partial [Anaeromyxobacteraceae bacterium]
VPALDSARALGVMAMVIGHTCDALLSPAARAAPLVVAYWKARGLTAPLFMMVSGWAVTLAVSRAPARGLALVRTRLPRVLLLLAIGYALRFPGWDIPGLLAGDPNTWRQLLAFDALHVIAAGLLALLLTLALPWSTRAKGLAFVLLAAVAMALGMRPAHLPTATAIPALALAQAFGGTSPFPVFPWVAYFFLGAAIPLLTDVRPIRRALAMGGVGAGLVAATCWQQAGALPPAHPSLVLFRVGIVLVLLAALETSSARVARGFAPLGRSSLSVYAIHLPIVYGWATLEGLAQRVGPRLTFSGAALTGVIVLVGALGAGHAMRLAGAGAVAVARRAWSRGRGALAESSRGSMLGSIHRGT